MNREVEYDCCQRHDAANRYAQRNQIRKAAMDRFKSSQDQRPQDHLSYYRAGHSTILNELAERFIDLVYSSSQNPF